LLKSSGWQSHPSSVTEASADDLIPTKSSLEGLRIAAAGTERAIYEGA
jgi:hypothetical protein